MLRVTTDAIWAGIYATQVHSAAVHHSNTGCTVQTQAVKCNTSDENHNGQIPERLMTEPEVASVVVLLVLLKSRYAWC